MAHLDRTGPTGKGPANGRKLGWCFGKDLDEKLKSLGKGMGLRRKGGGGRGLGRRLRMRSDDE
jgi:hypothetical protein